MRSLTARRDALDLEFDPVALFEMMDATIEGQQELKRIFRWLFLHLISGNDIMLGRAQGQRHTAGDIPRLFRARSLSSARLASRTHRSTTAPHAFAPADRGRRTSGTFSRPATSETGEAWHEQTAKTVGKKKRRTTSRRALLTSARFVPPRPEIWMWPLVTLPVRASPVPISRSGDLVPQFEVFQLDPPFVMPTSGYQCPNPGIRTGHSATAKPAAFIRARVRGCTGQIIEMLRKTFLVSGAF